MDQEELGEDYIQQVANMSSEGYDDDEEYLQRYDGEDREIHRPQWSSFKGKPKVEFVEVDFNEKDMEELVKIRYEVFVYEQKVDPDQEIDSFEMESKHFGLKYNGQFAGVCRLREKKPFVKLERIAIRKEFRSKKLGQFMCQKMIEESLERWPEYIPVAHAQSYALSFYKKLGAIVVGPEFMEEGIPHNTIAFMYHSDVQFEVLNYIPEVKEDFIPGEIEDPIVFRNIKETTQKIQSGHILSPMNLLFLVGEHVHEIGLWYPIFEKLLTYVFTSPFQPIQAKDRQEVNRLFKDLEEMIEHKIHAYPFSLVPDFWRKFYFSVRVLQSIWTVAEYAYLMSNADESTEIPDEIAVRQTAIDFMDKALTMGGNYLHRDIIINRINSLREGLPPIQFTQLEMNVLPTPPPLPNSQQIMTIDPIDEENFFDEFVCKRRPTIIRGGARMEAVKKWTLSYLASVLSYRTFPVEKGTRYTDDSWNQKMMRAQSFFDEISNPDIAHGPVYLAQHRLLEQVPELMDDVTVPSYCKVAGLKDEDVDINVWIGPAGTISPLHSDPKDNIFCQLIGKKFFRLVHAEDQAKLYLPEGMLSNTSMVDVGNPDFKSHPDFASVTVYDGIVEEGDLLYLPGGVFHYVNALTPSSSLSFWFKPFDD